MKNNIVDGCFDLICGQSGHNIVTSGYWPTCYYITSLGTSVFGLYFDFITRNIISGLGWGRGDFFIVILSPTILRLYTDFELHVYPGTDRKVCGWWVG